MVKALHLPKTVYSNKPPIIGLIAAYVLITISTLSGYISWVSINFILGAIVLPFTISVSEQSKPSSRFLIIAILLIGLSFVVPRPTAVFLALAASVIYLVESKTHRLSGIAFIVLLSMSPSIQYLVGIFSFPIRLWLTGCAGKVLHLSGTSTVVAGNMITFGGLDYSVDPACMGVKMLLTSLLCGLFVLVFLQKKYARRLTFAGVSLSLGAVFLLNLVSNIMRVVILVYFNIKPDAPMHEITGLICLVLYVLAPAYWVISAIVKKFGLKTTQGQVEVVASPVKGGWGVHFALFLLCGISALSFKLKAPVPHDNLVAVSGYRASWYNDDVAQYSNNTSLTYIKKIDGFLFADHNPVICWIGSGYEFESQQEVVVGGDTVFMGVLKKGNERLYTSWWYYNGRHTTTSQLAWRCEVAKGGKNFAVVNVTAASKEALYNEVLHIRNDKVFDRLF